MLLNYENNCLQDFVKDKKYKILERKIKNRKKKLKKYKKCLYKN